MKIDFYISSLSSGGAEHVLTNLAANFVKKNHEVSITSYEKRPQFYKVDSEIKVHRICHKEKNKLMEFCQDLKDTRLQLKERKADVAISFLSRCNFMLILAGAASRTKIVVCDRNNLRKKYPPYIFWFSCGLYAFADAVCVQTQEMKSFYPAFLQKKMFVLENPLDFEEMQMQCGGDDIVKANTVISIGRLEKQKDFSTLIRAFGKAVLEFPGWALNIYGQGEKRQELQDLIEDLKLKDHVKLCGVTHTPFLEMKKSKIFVLSSFFEGFPNVLCEAMHAGLPCIATNCECGPAELIDDGENGFLVPVGDVDEMAEKLKLLMEKEELREQIGKKAEFSTQRLESNLICEQWLKMIDRLWV